MTFSIQMLGAIALGGMLLLTTPLAAQSSFPLSLWTEHKKVTQIPWTVSAGKPHLRSDLQQELSFGVMIRPEDLAKSGNTHDLILFARVLEGANPITDVHSETPRVSQQLPVVPADPGAYWSLIAIVRPGKYKLELAMQDRATGRYSTRYEDVSVSANEKDALEQALAGVPKFEFVEMVKPPKRDDVSMLSSSMPRIRFPADLTRPRITNQMRMMDIGVSARPAPSFVIDRPNKLHLSVVTIVSPPELVLEDPFYLAQFQGDLMSYLSAFQRIDVINGTASLTAVDLNNRTLVLDRQDMKDVSLGVIEQAIHRDANTVSIEALKGVEDRASFFQDVLRAQFEAAEKETGDAEHVIIVVAARSVFPKGSSLRPLSPAQDCRCRVIHVRFSLQLNEPDDVDDLLKPYKPRLFEPLDWPEFRKDFGAIHQLLIR